MILCWYDSMQVGSAAVSAPLDGSGDVEIFIPSYELNQVSVSSFQHAFDLNIYFDVYLCFRFMYLDFRTTSFRIEDA